MSERFEKQYFKCACDKSFIQKYLQGASINDEKGGGVIKNVFLHINKTHKYITKRFKNVKEYLFYNKIAFMKLYEDSYD